MAEIRHLENRYNVFFSASPIWIKFRRLVQNDTLTAVTSLSRTVSVIFSVKMWRGVEIGPMCASIG